MKTFRGKAVQRPPAVEPSAAKENLLRHTAIKIGGQERRRTGRRIIFER